MSVPSLLVEPQKKQNQIWEHRVKHEKKQCWRFDPRRDYVMYSCQKDRETSLANSGCHPTLEGNMYLKFVSEDKALAYYFKAVVSIEFYSIGIIVKRMGFTV